jgi:hypothetical protein
MSDHITPDAINFRKVTEAAPRYRYQRMVLSNLNTGTFTLQPTASQLLEWKLPSNEVYNLSKSYIEYSASTSASTNPGYNILHEDVPAFFNSVQLQTAGGVDLCNLQNANNYLKVKQRQDVKNEDFLTADAYEALYPSNSLANANLRATSEVYQAGNLFGAPVGTGWGSIVNYLEPQHVKVSAVEAGGSESVMQQVRQYPLDMFSDTILAMDRDLFLPTDMYLRMNCFGPKMGFNSTSGTAFTPANSGNLNGAITFNNVALFLAIEQNNQIVDSIRERVLKNGLKFQIPYTMTFRNSTTGSGSAGVQIQFNRGFGKSIRKILHAPYHITEIGNTAFDCSNWNGSKITSYGTYMNSRKLQDQDISCLQASGTNVGMDDWLFNKKYYKNSVVSNGGQYQQAWGHTDTFAEPDNEQHRGVPDENIVDGFPLDIPAIWTMNAQVTGSLNHYTFVTFLRDVVIDGNGQSVTVY